ncbi:MAG: methyltransferase [Pontibacterium sp.]
MSDLTTLLHQQLSEAQGNCLWVADEHPMQTIAAPAKGQVLTNRFDVAEQLTLSGWSCTFNDFDFDALPESYYDTIVYRVSKERAVNHHVINQASEKLSPQGQLILLGHKQEGIKSYLSQAKKRFGHGEQSKVAGDLWLGRFEASSSLGKTLDDKRYSHLRQGEIKGHSDYWSKPGVYGWNKVDQGSALLVNVVKQQLADSPKAAHLLDLGCGYGYLSLNLNHLADATIATDNNAAAIAACQANLAEAANTQVIAANAGAELPAKHFDLLVCNPPFHAGFDTSNDLTEKFLRAAQELLSPQGHAYFVTNLHVPLEQKAAAYFSKVETLETTPHFRISRLKT